MIHTFELPREKLCAMSRFFEKAFEGGFMEAYTGTMHMADVSVELFRMFVTWVNNDQLAACSVEDLVDLYAFADELDIPGLRTAITDELTAQCFDSGFDIPDLDLLEFMMETIPQAYPIHNLFAIAVARLLWHRPEKLGPLPYWFAIRVKKHLDKPYGICDECCDEDCDSHDYCSHFWDQLSDYDPRRYHETTNGTTD